MDEDRRRQRRLEVAFIILVALLPLYLVLAYAAGYYLLPTVSVAAADPNDVHSFHYPGASVAVRRSFKYYWLAMLYQPAAAVEASLRGVSVSATVDEPARGPVLIIVDP
jgi:hypothetical protein